MTIPLCLPILAMFAVAGEHAQNPSTPSATSTTPIGREVAPHVFLLPGAVPEDRGPDGNTVMF